MKYIKSLSLLALGLAVLQYGRAAETAPTVAGPETAGLSAKAKGYILLSGTVRGIQVVALPSMKSTTIPVCRNDTETDDATVHTLSGPDALGRIAYIENHMMQKHHLLKVVGLHGGVERTIFARPGDALWDNAVSASLALAPVGGKVALAAHLQATQLPGAYLQQGILEIWDIATKTGHTTQIRVLDEGLSWFPDGRRLAYVTLVPKDRIKKLSPGSDHFGTEFKTWPLVPAVQVLDIKTGHTSFLAIGWHPVVATDGKSVLVGDYQSRWRLVRVSTGQSKPAQLPGLWGNPLALQRNDRALYWGLPTKGQRIHYSVHNSPLVGPKLMLTIKLGIVNTKNFKTLIPSIDPRAQVSYGTGAKLSP